MRSTPPKTPAQCRAATHGDTDMLYASLELSRSTWLVTSLAPGSDVTIQVVELNSNDA